MESLCRVLVKRNELLFLSLTVEALQGKRCQNSLPSGVGRSLGAKMSGGRGRLWGIFFGFYKTRHILLCNGANCTVLRAVVLRQYRRVTDRRTDGQTDGNAVANTALAMRAYSLQCEHCVRCNKTVLTTVFAPVYIDMTANTNFHSQLTQCPL